MKGERALHLVIDARAVQPSRTGVGNAVFRHLEGIERLFAAGRIQTWRVTVLRHAPALADAEFRSRWTNFLHLHFVETPADPASHPAGDYWQQVTLPRLLRRMGADVIYSPAYVGPLVTRRTARMVMIHDDMVWSQPSSYPWKFRAYLSTMTRLTASTAHRILYPTEDARRAVGKRLHIAPERSVAIHHGVDLDIFREASEDGREPLALCIASSERRKNHEVLVRALAEDASPRLLFVGFDERDRTRLEELRRIGGVARWEVRGRADERQIADYLARAAVLALPSRGEGFGIPVIEAMAVGTPLVLSDIPVFREVAGRAARYLHPDDHSGWRTAINEAVEYTPEVSARVEIGLMRIRKFTLESSAERLLKEARRAWQAMRAERRPRR